MALVNQKKPRLLPFDSLIGSGLGLAFFLLAFGARIIHPHHIDWLLNHANQDSVQHFVGWEFFRNEAWHMPLGMLTRFGFPIPTSVVYTDSIPLLAMLFKTLTARLPEQFQYFGLWYALCFILQGTFAWALCTYIIRQPTLSTTFVNIALKCCITLFFLMSPIMLNRMIEHQALVAHWVILASIFLYLRPCTQYTHRYWLILNTITVMIHAYLSVMVISIWIAFLLKQIIVFQSLSKIKALYLCLLTLLLMLFFAWLSGYFVIPLSSIEHAGGFGLNSMNLLAPLRPSSGSLTMPGHWSRFIAPFRSFYIEQGDEGFNYLGLGTLFLLSISLCCLMTRKIHRNIINRPLSKRTLGDEMRGEPARRTGVSTQVHEDSSTGETKQFAPTVAFRKRSNQWFPLLFICGCLALLSVSNIIYIGQYRLYSFALPSYLLNLSGVFRAPGRFFWPAYYVLMVIIFMTLNRSLRPPFVFPMIVFALFIQCADLSTKILELHHHFFRTQTTPLSSSAHFLQHLNRNFAHLVFLPAVNQPQIKIIEFTNYIHYAATHHMSVNLGYFARQNHHDYNAVSEQILRDFFKIKLSNDTLYIIHNPILVALLKYRLKGQQNTSIVPIGRYMAITTLNTP